VIGRPQAFGKGTTEISRHKSVHSRELFDVLPPTCHCPLSGSDRDVIYMKPTPDVALLSACPPAAEAHYLFRGKLGLFGVRRNSLQKVLSELWYLFTRRGDDLLLRSRRNSFPYATNWQSSRINDPFEVSFPDGCCRLKDMHAAAHASAAWLELQDRTKAIMTESSDRS
jgi:hypothetical protein